MTRKVVCFKYSGKILSGSTCHCITKCVRKALGEIFLSKPETIPTYHELVTYDHDTYHELVTYDRDTCHGLVTYDHDTYHGLVTYDHDTHHGLVT